MDYHFSPGNSKKKKKKARLALRNVCFFKPMMLDRKLSCVMNETSSRRTNANTLWRLSNTLRPEGAHEYDLHRNVPKAVKWESCAKHTHTHRGADTCTHAEQPEEGASELAVRWMDTRRRAKWALWYALTARNKNVTRSISLFHFVQNPKRWRRRGGESRRPFGVTSWVELGGGRLVMSLLHLVSTVYAAVTVHRHILRARIELQRHKTSWSGQSFASFVLIIMSVPFKIPAFVSKHFKPIVEEPAVWVYHKLQIHKLPDAFE